MGSEREQLVGEVMAAARRQIAEAVIFNQEVASRLGLSVREMQFLNLLELHGPLPAGRLAEMTGLSTGTVTGVLDRLEDTGYAKRARDDGDRRKVIVGLDGERVAREIVPQFAPLGDRLSQELSRYSVAELRVIAAFVGRTRLAGGSVSRSRALLAPAE